MKEIGPEQLAELPVWARRHIKNLERDLASARQAIELLSVGPPDSNVRVHNYVHPDQLLARNALIRFILDAGDYIEVKHQDSDTVTVRCVGDSIDRQALHITPQSSNVAKIRLGTY